MNLVGRSLLSSKGRLAGLAAVTATLVLAGAAPSFAAYTTSGIVSVVGHGEASAVPDMAVLNAGIEVTKATANEALDAQAAAAQAVLDAVRAQGLTNMDIRTESMSLNPVYTYSEAGAQLTGYQASQALSLKIHDVDEADDVVQAVVTAGGDAARINGIVFEAEDSKGLMEKARTDAFWDAYGKASQYAEISGLRLGRPLSIDETSDAHPFNRGGEAAGRTADAPMAPGEVYGDVDTSVVFELK
ncbi:SIMPL domain-containing protein [Streptomyces sp. NPDC057686]|uniref:SIMPL domain-containing protein n=1 Tax=Streptomyces sp. NPDC057686 TaxID=3346212 RepID=UPI0036C92DD9